MAISPDKLLQEMERKDRPLIEALDKGIEGWLVTSFNGFAIQATPYELYKMSPGSGDRHLTIVLQRYREMGWTVAACKIRRSDQRDGEWTEAGWEFSATPKSISNAQLDADRYANRSDFS